MLQITFFCSICREAYSTEYDGVLNRYIRTLIPTQLKELNQKNEWEGKPTLICVDCEAALEGGDIDSIERRFDANCGRLFSRSDELTEKILESVNHLRRGVKYAVRKFF